MIPPETPLPEEVYRESITKNIVKQQDTKITEAKNVGPTNEAVSDKVVIRRDTFSLPRTLSVDKIPEVLLETQKQYVSLETPPKQVVLRRDTYSLPRALSVDKIPEVIPETQKQYMELHFSDKSDDEVLLKSEKGFRENEIAEEEKETEQIKMAIEDPGESKEQKTEFEKLQPLERNGTNEATLETAKEQINGEIQCNQKVAELAIHTEDEEKARHENLTCQEVSYVIESKKSFTVEIETDSRIQPNLETANLDDTFVSVTPVTDVSLIETKSDTAVNDNVDANQVTDQIENKFTVAPSIPSNDDVVNNWKAQREALTEKRNQFLIKENELLTEENKNQVTGQTQNEILIVPSVPTIDDVVDNWKAERKALTEKRKQFLLNEHEVLSEENKDYVLKEERAFWKIRRDQMWKKREAFLKESEDAIDDLILAKIKSNASNSELSSNSSVINDDNFPEENSRVTSLRPASGASNGEKASRIILKESIPQELIPYSDADVYAIQRAPANGFSDISIPKEPNQSIDNINETKFVKHFGNSSPPVESDQEHNLTKDKISENSEEGIITHEEIVTTLDIAEETKQKDPYSESIYKTPKDSAIETAVQRIENEPPENIPKASGEDLVVQTLQRAEEEPSKHALPTKESNSQPENILETTGLIVNEPTLENPEEEQAKSTLHIKQNVIQSEYVSKTSSESVLDRKSEEESVEPLLPTERTIIQPENNSKTVRESAAKKILQKLEEELLQPTLLVKQSLIQPENVSKTPRESVVERTLQRVEEEPVKPTLLVKQTVIQPENIPKAPRESAVERTLKRLEEEPAKLVLLVKQSVIQPENIPKAPRESAVERTLQRLEEEPAKPALVVKQSIIQPEKIPKAPRESVVERTLQRLEEEPAKPALVVKQSVIQPEKIPKAPRESVVERTLQRLEEEPAKPALVVKQSVIQPEKIPKAPRESAVERTLQRLEEKPAKPALPVKQSVIQPENIPKAPKESVVERTLKKLEEEQEDVIKNAGDEIDEKVVVLHDIPADRLFENIQSDFDEESKKPPFIVKQSIIKPILFKKAPRESVVERSFQKLEEISENKKCDLNEDGEDEPQNDNEEESITPVQLEENIVYTLVDKFYTNLEDNSKLNYTTEIPRKTLSNRDETYQEGNDSEELITSEYLEETIDLNNLDSLHAKSDPIPESLSIRSSPKKTPTQPVDVINEVFDNLSDAVEVARKQVIEAELNHAGTEGQENEEILTNEIEYDEETEWKSDIFAVEELEKDKTATVVTNNDAVNNEDQLERQSAEISENIAPVSVKNGNSMIDSSVLDINDRVAVVDEKFEPIHDIKVQEEQSNVNEGTLPVEIKPGQKRNKKLEPATELQGETTKTSNTSFIQEANASLENEKLVETNTAITSKQSNMQQDFHSASVTELKDSHLRVTGNETEIPLKQEESVRTFSQISVDEKQMLVSSLELIRSESGAAIEIIENLSKDEKKFGRQAVKKGVPQPITEIQDDERLVENQNITIDIRKKTERAISAPLGQSTPYTTLKHTSILVQEEFCDTELQGFYEDITRNVSQINTTEASVIDENEDMVPPGNIGPSNRGDTLSSKEKEPLKDSPENVVLNKNVSSNERNIIHSEFVDSGIVDETIDVTTIMEDGLNEITLPSCDVFKDDNPSGALERDSSFPFQDDFDMTLKNTREEGRQQDKKVSSDMAEENVVTEEEQSKPVVKESSKEAHELDQKQSLIDKPSKEKLDKTTLTEKINKADLAVQVSTEDPNTARSVEMQNLKDIGTKDERSPVIEPFSSQGMIGIEKIKLDIKLEGLLVVDKVQTVDKATLTGSIEETKLLAQTDAEISYSAEPVENENLETMEDQNLTEVKPVSDRKSDVIELVEIQKSIEIEYLENQKLKIERPVPDENLDEVAEEEILTNRPELLSVKTTDQATLTDFIKKEEKETQADNEISDMKESVKLDTFIGGGSEHELQVTEEVRDSSQELKNVELIKDLNLKEMLIKNEEPEVQTGNEKLLEMMSDKTEVCDKTETLTEPKEKATLKDALINEETLVQTDELENEKLNSQEPVERDILVEEYNENDLEEMETLNESFSVASGKFSFTPDSESYENERKTHISVYDPVDLASAPADQAYANVNDKKPISRVASLKSMKFDTEPSQELTPSIDNSGNGSLNIATLKTLTGESVTVESDSDILPKDTTYSDTANNTSDDEHLYPRLPPDDFKGLYNLKPPASCNGDNTSGGSLTESSRPASEDEGVITYQRLPPDDFKNTNEMRLLKTPFQRVLDDETSYTDNSVSEMDGIIRYQRLPPDDYKTASRQTQGNVENYKLLDYQDQELTRYSRLKSVDLSQRSFGSPITNERIPASPIITNRQPQKYTIDKKFVSPKLSSL